MLITPGWLRAGPYTPASPPEEGLAFPDQDGGYLSTLPNRASYGMDANGGGLPTLTAYVTSTADDNVGGEAPSFGPNAFAGTWEYCWKLSHSGYHKRIRPLVGGWVEFANRSINTPAGAGNVSYLGQTAPGQGLYVRGGALRLNGGSDMRVWHLASYIGDTAGGLDAGGRDSLQLGNSAYTPSKLLWINCTGAWGMDETVDAYIKHSLCTYYQCAFFDPIHVSPTLPHPSNPPGGDHGFTHIIGGGNGQTDKVAVFGCLYAHGTDRHPLTAAWRFAMANSITYNAGRPGGGKGEGINIFDNNGHNATAGQPMYANVARNLAIRGPEANDSLCFARTLGTLPANSHAHCEGNVQHGWSNPANQDGFFTSKPAGYMQSSLTQAWPSGWGSDYSGTLQIAANPLAATLAEKQAFVDFIMGSVGAMPNRRTGVERLATIHSQMTAALNDESQSFQFINSVADAGGWFEVTPASIADPTAANPTWWHAPLPINDGDDVLLSGTFSNGASKVGYTKWDAWDIEQHYFVGGQ